MKQIKNLNWNFKLIEIEGEECYAVPINSRQGKFIKGVYLL